MRFVQILLIAALSPSLQSQPPIPAPGKTNQNNEQEINGKDTKIDPDKQSAQKHAPGVDKTISQVTSGNEHKPATQTKNETSAPGWLIASTVVSALATFGIAVLGYFQWRAMHRQAGYMANALESTQAAADAATSAAETASETLAQMKATGDETKTQIDRLISEQQRTANAMERSLERAQDAMDISERQSKAARDASVDNSRLHLRPWVGLTDDDSAIVTTPVAFDSEGNASINYAVTVKNFGTSAAQNVMSCAFLIITEDIDALWVGLKIFDGGSYIGQPKMGFVLFAGKIRFTQQSGSTFQKSRMVSPSCDGKFQGWLVGCIGYRDQFQHLYRTNFIYRLMNPDTNRAVQFEPAPNTTVNGVFVPWHTSFE